MYFENKEIDPRDCQYRANPKIRKQIEQVIRINKIKHGLIGGKGTEDDALRKTAAKTSAVKNRFKSAKKGGERGEDNKENHEKEDAVLKEGFSKEKMIAFLEQLDSILLHEEEQKQAFSYEDLVKMHQLLQYLEEEDADREQLQDGRKGKNGSDSGQSFRNQYFFQFMEGNFRVIQPEKRKNAALDERLRKLKYQAASNDYDTMTANVSRAFRGFTKGGPGSSRGFSMSQELRNIRSTLIATANAFMVIVATFAFFYIAFGYARPDYSTANRVLFSFSASMVVAVAEIYFLIRII